jgi:hypothetical protein
MMWNTKYGMMSGMIWGLSGPTAAMTVTPGQTSKHARQFIGSYIPGGKGQRTGAFLGLQHARFLALWEYLWNVEC